jgi:hypothetical protein
MKQVYHAKERSAAMNYTELASCLRMAVEELKTVEANKTPCTLRGLPYLIERCEAALKTYDGQWTP